MPKSNDRKRIVIITQGDKPVVYTEGNGIVKETPVPKISPEKIIDIVIFHLLLKFIVMLFKIYI